VLATSSPRCVTALRVQRLSAMPAPARCTTASMGPAFSMPPYRCWPVAVQATCAEPRDHRAAGRTRAMTGGPLHAGACERLADHAVGTAHQDVHLLTRLTLGSCDSRPRGREPCAPRRARTRRMRPGSRVCSVPGVVNREADGTGDLGRRCPWCVVGPGRWAAVGDTAGTLSMATSKGVGRGWSAVRGESRPSARLSSFDDSGAAPTSRRRPGGEERSASTAGSSRRSHGWAPLPLRRNPSQAWAPRRAIEANEAGSAMAAAMTTSREACPMAVTRRPIPHCGHDAEQSSTWVRG